MMLGLALAATLHHHAAPPRAPAAHRISTLPSLEQPLPSRHFSGLVGVPAAAYDFPWTGSHEALHTHYWFAERESDAASAPIVLWLQGGPGGSSLGGSFTEMGPLTLDDRSWLTASANRTGIPSPLLNPHGWTKAANFLAVEYANIGFSFCDAHPPHSQHEIHKCGWDDAAVANALLGFLRGFYQLFPDYTANELWIAGESYAGILCAPFCPCCQVCKSAARAAGSCLPHAPSPPDPVAWQRAHDRRHNRPREQSRRRPTHPDRGAPARQRRGGPQLGRRVLVLQRPRRLLDRRLPQ